MSCWKPVDHRSVRQQLNLSSSSDTISIHHRLFRHQLAPFISFYRDICCVVYLTVSENPLTIGLLGNKLVLSLDTTSVHHRPFRHQLVLVLVSPKYVVFLMIVQKPVDHRAIRQQTCLISWYNIRSPSPFQAPVRSKYDVVFLKMSETPLAIGLSGNELQVLSPGTISVDHRLFRHQQVLFSQICYVLNDHVRNSVGHLAIRQRTYCSFYRLAQTLSTADLSGTSLFLSPSQKQAGAWNGRWWTDIVSGDKSSSFFHVVLLLGPSFKP